MGCFKVKIISSKGDHLQEVTENNFTIGRSKKADIKIIDSSISREHVLVSKVKDDIYITDMETANGT
ncbi:MAG: FHA domain-containing protein, partial [Halobacteriovoraceae bacterium]|nr:FHA domain-containing protein [Halobacteriovoraceae bacterium]